jgi:hypothetical protein
MSRRGGVSMRVEAHNLTEIHAALKSLGSRELMVVYRRAVKRAAEPLAAEVRQRYAQFSRRIPRAVRIKVRAGGRVVMIEAGGTPTTQHARVVEGLPNGQAARHPVFARGPRDSWTWVAQQPPRQVVAKVVASSGDAFTRNVVNELIRELDRLL